MLSTRAPPAGCVDNVVAMDTLPDHPSRTCLHTQPPPPSRRIFPVNFRSPAAARVLLHGGGRTPGRLEVGLSLHLGVSCYLQDVLNRHACQYALLRADKKKKKN